MSFLIGAFMGIATAMIFVQLMKMISDVETDIKNIKLELEVLQTERDYFKDELNKHKKWSEFLPGQMKEGEVGPIPPVSSETIISTPDQVRKYNPDEVPGLFDDMFTKEPETETKEK